MTIMTATLTLDRHRYIQTLRSAGMDEKLTNAHAPGLADALQETVATKTDIADLRAATKADIADLRSTFETKFVAIDNRFASMQSHLDVKFAEQTASLTKQASDNQRLLIGIIVAIVLAGVTVASIITRPVAAPAAIFTPAKT
jgi:hypothetical protein